MKKLLLFILLISSTIYAQDDYISGSFGFDIKNGLIGSKPTGNEPALDWTGELHIVDENVDYNVGYEKFSMLNFSRKYVAVGYHIYIGDVWGTNIKFSIQPSVEISNIDRGFNTTVIDIYDKPVTTFTHKSWTTPSININWNWDINKYFAVQIASNFLPRRDVQYIYKLQHPKFVLSEGIKFVIKVPM